MEKREKYSKPITIFFLLSFTWVFLQFAAPLLTTENTIRDLSGFTILRDNQRIVDKMVFPFNIVYSAGDVLCHQRADRSIFINGNQMPFCTRCTSIWTGLTTGLFLMMFFKTDLNEKYIFFLFIGVTPLIIDGTGQFLGFWTSNNLSRILTGLIAGGACGTAAGVIIDEIKTIVTICR